MDWIAIVIIIAIIVESIARLSTEDAWEQELKEELQIMY